MKDGDDRYMKLHEIELYSKDPEASKKFYHEILGLGIDIYASQKELKVFRSGWDGLDIDASQHFPRKVSISFLVKNIDEYVKRLREKGIDVEDPKESHLGMRAFSIIDPDGYRIEIQSPTEKSPEWLRRMI